MHPRLDELAAYLDRTRAALEESAAAIPPAECGRRPEPDAWSAAEVLDHLSRVDAGIVKMLAKLLARAAESGLGPEEATDSVLGRLDRFRVESGEPRLRAGERVQPSRDADPGRSLAALRASRAELHRILAAADGLALGRLTAPHPFLGELDFYQWVLFLGQHEERHRRQIVAIGERIRAAGG